MMSIIMSPLLQHYQNSHDHISQFLNVIFGSKTPEQYENKAVL